MRINDMNEQIANESNEKPRILIVDNNAPFADRVRLLLEAKAAIFLTPLLSRIARIFRRLG